MIDDANRNRIGGLARSSTRRLYLQIDPPHGIVQGSDQWHSLANLGINARDIFNEAFQGAIRQVPELENFDNVPTFREKPKTPAVTELFVGMYTDLDPIYQYLLLQVGEEAAKSTIVRVVRRTRSLVSDRLQRDNLPADGFSCDFSQQELIDLCVDHVRKTGHPRANIQASIQAFNRLETRGHVYPKDESILMGWNVTLSLYSGTWTFRIRDKVRNISVDFDPRAGTGGFANRTVDLLGEID